MAAIFNNYRIPSAYSFDTRIGGKRIRSHPNGSFSVQMPEGEAVIFNEMNVELDLKIVRSIGVTSLQDIESHAVNTIAGSRSHVIRFVNGGVLQFAYNNAGQIIELYAEKIRGRITPSKEILFSLHGS